MDKEQYTHRDEIVCNSLKDIFNEIKIIKDNEKGINSFFYRGQGDANWYLASKMKRDNIEHYKNSDDKEKIKIILKEIEEEKRCLTKFLNDYKDDIQVMKDIQENIKINGRALKIITLDTIIDIDKDISIIALMQHYGEKTRALDFTRNLLVALFFAVGIDDLEMDAALWVLNKNMMFNILQNQFQNSYKAFPVDEDLMFREREQYANY